MTSIGGEFENISNKKTAISFICNLYERYKSPGHISWVNIAKKAKNYMIRFTISKQEIENHFKQEPSLTKQWLQYTEDIRWPSAPVIHCFTFKNNQYEFGVVTNKKNIFLKNVEKYSIVEKSNLPFEVCTNFLIAFIEYLCKK